VKAGLNLGRPLAAALCIAAVVLASAPALANGLTAYPFTAVATGDGPYTGRSYSGSFSYDASVLTNSGEEEVNVAVGSLTVSFDFEGQHFDQTNDVDFSGYPVVTVVDGQPAQLNYLLVQGENGVSFADPKILEVSLINDLVPISGGPGFTVEASVALVPEPATAGLMGFGIAVVGLLRARRARLASPIQT